MPPFPRPTFAYDYAVATELRALRRYQLTAPDRAIPPKQNDRLLLATWNIANLGVQARRDKDYRLIAEIIGWFDLIAVQEVADGIIVDYDAQGRIVGVEILDASKRTDDPDALKQFSFELPSLT